MNSSAITYKWAKVCVCVWGGECISNANLYIIRPPLPQTPNACNFWTEKPKLLKMLRGFLLFSLLILLLTLNTLPFFQRFQLKHFLFWKALCNSSRSNTVSHASHYACSTQHIGCVPTVSSISYHTKALTIYHEAGRHLINSAIELKTQKLYTSNLSPEYMTCYADSGAFFP